MQLVRLDVTLPQTTSRTVGYCNLEDAEVHAVATLSRLVAAPENGNTMSDLSCVILNIVEYVRSFVLPLGAVRIGSLRLQRTATPESVAEWNRFCVYLVHGLDGRSALKAGVLRCADSPGRFVVVPEQPRVATWPNDLAILDLHNPDTTAPKARSTSDGIELPPDTADFATAQVRYRQEFFPLAFAPPLATAGNVQDALTQMFAVLEDSDDADAVLALAPMLEGPSRNDDGTAVLSAPEHCLVDVCDSTHRDHLTPLMKAAKHGRLACVTALVRTLKANPNAIAKRSRYTALGLAAYGGHTQICNFLLSVGADPTISNRYNESATRVAETRGHTKLATMLRTAVDKWLASSNRQGMTSLPSPSQNFVLRSGAHVSVRDSATTDTQALRALYTTCQSEYRDADPGVADAWLRNVLTTDMRDPARHYQSIPRARMWVAIVPSDSALASTILAASDDGQRNTTFIVDNGSSVVVGCVAVLPCLSSVPETSAETVEVAELQRMCVHPTLHRSGLATALLSHAEMWALRVAGYNRMHLSTLGSMAPAVGFYRARNYREVTPPGGIPKSFHGFTIYYIEFEKQLTNADADTVDDTAVGPTSVACIADVGTDAQCVRPEAQQEHKGAREASLLAPMHDAALEKSPATYMSTRPLDDVALRAAAARHFLRAAQGHGLEYVPQRDVDAAIASRGTALEALVSRVTQWIVRGVIPFPFKRTYTSEAQVVAWFDALVALPSVHLLRFESYGLHGFHAAGRTVTVIVDGPLRPATAGSLSSAQWMLNGRRTVSLNADGPKFLLPSMLAAANPAQDVAQASSPTLSVVSVLACGPVFKPFDRDFNDAGGHIIDYFVEPARMAARRRDQATCPLEMWREPAIAERIVTKALRKFREVTDFSLRHGQYGAFSTANLFHANLARSLIDLLGGTRVLDPCAGWGDRLVGAMASPRCTRYLGFDPNTALIGPHAAMIATFGSRCPGKGAYSVVCAPFEDAVLPDSLGFDLVLTSPPYFDLEIYEVPASIATAEAPAGAIAPSDSGPSDRSVLNAASGCGAQSIERHGTSLAAWLSSWYFPMLSKAWSALEPGGHFAIYINDHATSRNADGVDGDADDVAAGCRDGAQQKFQDLDICVAMLEHVASGALTDAVWVGVIGIQGETGAVRPLWVWRRGDVQNGVGPSARPPLYDAIWTHYKRELVGDHGGGAANGSVVVQPPVRRKRAIGLDVVLGGTKSAAGE